MRTREWTTIDKSTWGDGEWQQEPDKMQWQDRDTGLPCLIVRSPSPGSLCGYVGVPPSHPYHGKGYNDTIAGVKYCIESSLEVHGGVTFAGGCEPGDDSSGICHVPDAGEPDNVWWIGFDCGHSQDVMPGLEAQLAKASDESLKKVLKEFADAFEQWKPAYKTIAYVQAECTDLARQLARIIERCATPSL